MVMSFYNTSQIKSTYKSGRGLSLEFKLGAKHRGAEILRFIQFLCDVDSSPPRMPPSEKVNAEQ